MSVLPSSGQLPDFLLVGAACCGAETLLAWLGQHPEIHASPIAETNYFVAKELGTEGVMDKALLRTPRLGVDDGEFRPAEVAHVVGRADYERCFHSSAKPDALRRGEASPAYLFYPGAARRISEEIPDCKIVVLLRDPVERTLANYALLEAQGREHLGLEDALEQERRRLAEGWSFHWSYLGQSLYVAALTRYLARFPLQGIHLVRAESLENPATRPAEWRSLLQFLGVAADAPLPVSARADDAFSLPVAGSAGSSESARRTVAERLGAETHFFRSVFAEAPFQRAALRRLATGSSVPADIGVGFHKNGSAAAASKDPDPAAGSVFQHLLLASDPFREPLYYRKISSNAGLHPRLSSAGTMNFRKDENFAFDGYFNAFFESLVAEHTGLRSIQLRLEFSGRFFIEIIRLAQARAPQVIATAESERRLGDGPLVMEVDLTTDSPLGSRLIFHITCLSKEGHFAGGCWWTTAKPRRHVQLDILACTFKKREFIERTVRRVADYRRLDRGGYHITVVDNGSDLPTDLFFSYPNVRIVPQGNVGGAGGAARGLMEGLVAQGRPQPTHFLLMDDDIELEPDMVLRAMSWLRFLKTDHCLGGGMLDLYRPTHLHELGCWLGRPRLLSVTACIGELELTGSGAMDKLGQVPVPHFNAWWFMAISREAVEKNGLPLPCFIRGDDKEFGFRMLQGGVPTLPIPGIAVWHMPFYAKVSAWLFYYNMYNDLLIRSLRYPELSGDTVADAVWAEIEHYLEKLEYDQAATRVLGLEDFLRGPRWLLETDCEARFKEIMTVSKEFAAEHRKDVEPTKFNSHFNPKTQLDLRWRRWIHNGHLPLKWRKPVYTDGGVPRKVIKIDDWGWTDVTYFDEIGVKHPLMPGLLIFRKRPDVYFDLLRRAKAGLEILRREWSQRAAEFRAHEAELVSPAFWRRHLKMDSQQQQPAATVVDAIQPPRTTVLPSHPAAAAKHPRAAVVVATVPPPELAKVA